MSDPEKKHDFKKWYDENKETISKKRKKRYAEDPEFAEKARERSRQRQRENYQPAGPKTAPGFRPRTVMLDGKPVVVYSIAFLSDFLGYTRDTILRWHSKEVIPPPTITDGRGRRWYSEEYAQFLKDCIEQFRDDEWSLARFRKVIGEELKRRGGIQ